MAILPLVFHGSADMKKLGKKQDDETRTINPATVSSRGILNEIHQALTIQILDHRKQDEQK